MENFSNQHDKNETSIYSCLNESQITKIISIIKERCDKEIQKEKEKKEEINELKISKEIYDKLKKSRKAHILTFNLYIDLFTPQNNIEGFQYGLTENGNYFQPELENDHVLIHIYHKSDLNSKLIKRRAESMKPFYCIQFSVNNSGELKSIEAHLISRDGSIFKTENIFKKTENL